MMESSVQSRFSQDSGEPQSEFFITYSIPVLNLFEDLDLTQLEYDPMPNRPVSRSWQKKSGFKPEPELSAGGRA